MLIQYPHSMSKDEKIETWRKLDAGWPNSEEEHVGNVKLEEKINRKSKEGNQVKTNGFIDKKTDRHTQT